MRSPDCASAATGARTSNNAVTGPWARRIMFPPKLFRCQIGYAAPHRGGGRIDLNPMTKRRREQAPPTSGIWVPIARPACPRGIPTRARDYTLTAGTNPPIGDALAPLVPAPAGTQLFRTA